MKNKKLLLMGLMLFAGAQKVFASEDLKAAKVPYCACVYKASYKLRTAFNCRYSASDLYYAIQTENYDRLKGLLKRTNVAAPAVQRLVFTAIYNNDKQALKMLLDAGVDVNYTDSKNQMPPLSYAVKYKPASVNPLTYLGYAPSGNNGIVEFLLGREGIDVNKVDGDNNSALNVAMSLRLKYWDTAVILLRAGINPNHNPDEEGSNLEDAVRSGDLALVKELIDRGFNLSGNGITALQRAVNDNATDLVTEMTKAARDNGDATQKVDLTSRQLHDLLFTAVSNNNPQIFGSLSASFAEMAIDYNYQDKDGNTMLHKAVQAYSTAGTLFKGTDTLPMIQTLIAYGANPNITNRAGRTPMDLAGANKNVRTVLAAAAAQILVAE